MSCKLNNSLMLLKKKVKITTLVDSSRRRLKAGGKPMCLMMWGSSSNGGFPQILKGWNIFLVYPWSKIQIVGILQIVIIQNELRISETKKIK